MGWTMFRERGGSEDKMRFKEAAMMAKRGLEMMRELAEEMEERYSESGGSYGQRDGYGERGEYGERDYYERRIYSRGRYM